jgi:hypothetical protein
VLATGPIHAKTFRYAFQGDLNALDPYTLNERFTLGLLGDVYEGLTKRDKDLKIIPGLAERWEIIDPLRPTARRRRSSRPRTMAHARRLAIPWIVQANCPMRLTRAGARHWRWRLSLASKKRIRASVEAERTLSDRRSSG